MHSGETDPGCTVLESSGGAKPTRFDPKCGQREGFRTADVDGELPVPHRSNAVSSLVAETDRLRVMLESGTKADRLLSESEVVPESDRLPTVLENDAVCAKPVKLLE